MTQALLDEVPTTALATSAAPSAYVDDLQQPDGLRSVHTHAIAVGLPRLLRCVRMAGFGVVDGFSGTGKSHLLAMLRDRIEGHCGVIQARRLEKETEFAVALREAIDPEFTGEATAWRHEMAIRRLLKQQKTTLIIDDAHVLWDAFLDSARQLWDISKPRLTLIIAGAGITEKILLNPHVDTRPTHRVRVKPLSSQEWLDVLRAYHPLLAGAEDGVLEQVYGSFAAGTFRHWQYFTRHCQDWLIDTGQTRITHEIALMALSDLTGVNTSPQNYELPPRLIAGA